MSGVAVVRYLLANNAPVIAIVPAARIMAGDLPINVTMPAISVKKISGIPRLTIAMTEPNRMQTDRVQVAVVFKLPSATPAGTGYPGLDAVMKLLLAACPNQRGTVNSVNVDSILPDVEGPDLQDDVTGLVSRSRDFVVKWRAAS